MRKLSGEYKRKGKTETQSTEKFVLEEMKYRVMKPRGEQMLQLSNCN